MRKLQMSKTRVLRTRLRAIEHETTNGDYILDAGRQSRTRQFSNYSGRWASINHLLCVKYIITLINPLPARLIASAIVFTVAIYPPQIILHRELSDLPADLVRLHARPAEMNAAEDACVNYIAGRVPEAPVGARHAVKRGAGRAEACVVT